MKARIQNIVFPDLDFRGAINLFFHEDIPYIGREGIAVAGGRQVSFASYLNSFSYRKWKEYTGLRALSLHLKIKGAFRLDLVGYILTGNVIERKFLASAHYELDDFKEIEMEIPKNQCSLVAFEIEAQEKTEISGGFYEGEFEDNAKNPVHLSIATTTFKKEEYIEKNIDIIERELLSDDEIGKNIWLNVVDNGRSLVKRSRHPHVHIHPNKNVGGAGGFARGMIESLDMEERITHVLLMDDDVLVMSESIRRMYYLLSFLKEEYKGHLISGAMLRMEEMNIQQEDIGFIDAEGACRGLKRIFDCSNLFDILCSDREPIQKDNMYAAWWMCCIPREYIEKNRLPLPLFFRGDDVEYGNRGKARIISMNSICVWHSGFSTRYNPFIEIYLSHRNLLFIQAASDIAKGVNFATRMYKMYRGRLLSLDYEGAGLMLDAFEDFLKGPDFFAKDQGEAILRDKSSKLEKLDDLDHLRDVDLKEENIWKEEPRGILRKFLFRLSYNGQRILPKCFLRKQEAQIPFNLAYYSGKIALRERIVQVDIYSRKGRVLIRDKARYRALRRREKEIFSRFHREYPRIRRDYAARQEEFTSREFWEKYLEIDQYRGE